MRILVLKQNDQGEVRVKKMLLRVLYTRQPLLSDRSGPGINEPGATAVCGSVRNSPDIEKAASDRARKNVSADANSKSNSPEQKIYLERQKQKELLQEQSSFDSLHLQDERWKRIERELEKAFASCHPNTNVRQEIP